MVKRVERKKILAGFLPEGMYLLAVETSPGNWSLLRTPLGAPDRVLALAGLQNDLSDLLLP